MSRIALLVVLVLALAGVGARAQLLPPTEPIVPLPPPERLIASLSTHRLQIQSNFVGGDIVLFGSIERETAAIARPGGYDIAVVVRGPRAVVVTRRKQRVFGIWMNTEEREFVDVPSAYAVLSNRPIANVGPIELRRRHQIGLDAMILLQRARIGEDAETGGAFREALVRQNVAKRLYREAPTGVTFLTPTLFRATIPVAPNTPTGNFDVDIFLFSEGQFISREQTSFEIIKTGFEAFVANAARDNGLAYGLFAALMALATGWIASAAFRRD